MSDTGDNSLKNLEKHQRSTLSAIDTLSKLESISPNSLKGELLLTIDKLKLIYFAPKTAIRSAPLLICYALVNRPYILDLEPKRSLIRDLLDKGIPVYLIDWGYPDITDRHLGLDDYLLDYLDSCVTKTREHGATKKINLLGVCQGGVFSLLYASIKPDQLNKLITLVTPIDAHAADFMLAQMIREVNVTDLVKLKGNLSGSLLNRVYASLKPLQLGIYKQLYLADNLNTEIAAASFLRMEHWINDSPNLAGQAAIEFAEQFFKSNGLMHDTFKVGEQAALLKNIVAPVLNIYGEKDHLVPPSSSRALANCLKPDLQYQELALSGGHIGTFISNRSRHRVVNAITAWIG